MQTNDSPQRSRIEPAQLRLQPHNLFSNQWLLLASGDYRTNRYNCMTIAWGSIGTMWNKPFVQVVVRPQRYTYTFMEEYPTFTVSAFRPAFRPALQQLGTRSGRTSDKLANSGLTPEASLEVGAPSFVEADITIECLKMYWQDLDPKGFVMPNLRDNYPAGDYHRAYFGEIVAIYATDDYVR